MISENITVGLLNFAFHNLDNKFGIMEIKFFLIFAHN